MGHVPAGSFREEGQGDDLPRRQHRGAGTGDLITADPAARRRLVGRLGERVAERFLVDRRAQVLGRNVRVGRGEVDLHVRIDGVVVAVEVKALVRGAHDFDPAIHFDDEKAGRVWALARSLDPPARRVDLVTVILDGAGAAVSWRPGGDG